MIKYFIVFLLLKSILFGCSLCSIYKPQTHVTTHVKTDKTHIKTLNVSWTFASEFTKELMQIYDTNLDASFDDVELALIQTALIDYLKPKNFITFISYDKQINQKSDSFEVKNYKMSFKNKTLGFEYSIDLNYQLYDKNILYIKIQDDENYFDIVFDDKKQLMNIPYKISKTSTINDVTFIIEAPTLDIQEEKEKPQEVSVLQKTQIEKETKTEIIKEEIKPKEENILDKFTLSIKKYLLDIQKGEDKFALILLLMVSFIYGVIHSIGPGHGKALAFSYFSSQKSSYFEAFIISLATAFVHIIGALIIVLISVFILQSVMNNFMENSISYITSFSALIIMFLALYILYKKLTKKSCSCCSCSVPLKTTNFTIKPQTNINFLKTTFNKPILVKPRNKKQDLFFILSAGIIPCPGTVLLFVYAFLLKTYFAVVLASISISLGMATVIFASSFLGVSAHKLSSKSKKLVNVLEIVSPIFMFILALLLFFNSIKF